MVMNRPHFLTGFSLIELLIVMSIIGLLMSILLPVLSSAREAAQGTQCLANLHSQGTAMSAYQQDFEEYFPPYYRPNFPTTGRTTYFWGVRINSGPNLNKIDRSASWMMGYCDATKLEMFLCPSQPWGGYVPQGNVTEASTNYGYNAWSLFPQLWNRRDSRGNLMINRRTVDISDPSRLLAFADSGMYWKPIPSMWIFQNSTSLDPVRFSSWNSATQQLTWSNNTTPTNHFRHRGTTQALLTDGHAQAFGAPNSLLQPSVNLGFVSEQNSPYYDQ